MTEPTLIERLRENIVADAFAQGRILDGALAERLIRERHGAAHALEALAQPSTPPVLIDGLREALAELVACKDLKDSKERDGDGKRMADYYRRQPLAWQAARAALSQSPAVAP